MYFPRARSASKLSRADSSSPTLGGVPANQPLVGQTTVELLMAVCVAAASDIVRNRITHTIAMFRFGMFFTILDGPGHLLFLLRHCTSKPIACQPCPTRFANSAWQLGAKWKDSLIHS